jgi:thioredoxin-dependent peroxiredoxin
MPFKHGDFAPDFTLPDQNNRLHTLSAYRGQWVLLYFYPKDDTPGCTKEACTFRDSFPNFQNLPITVMGISLDSVQSHQKFAQKYTLPFTLLADEHRKVVELYDAWGLGKLLPKRMSYLIDPEGKIAKIYEHVTPDKHADEVLHDLQQQQA